jgi:hypothetical protein
VSDYTGLYCKSPYLQSGFGWHIQPVNQPLVNKKIPKTTGSTSGWYSRFDRDDNSKLYLKRDASTVTIEGTLSCKWKTQTPFVYLFYPSELMKIL